MTRFLNPETTIFAVWIAIFGLAVHIVTASHFYPAVHVPMVLAGVLILKILNAMERPQYATLPATRGLHRTIPGSYNREEL